MYQFSKDLLACYREQDLINSPTFLPPFPPLAGFAKHPSVTRQALDTYCS